MHLILHAWAVIPDQPTALAQREHLVDGVQQHIHLFHRRIRTEKLHLVGLGVARGEYSWKFLFGDGNPWIRLVILQHDVVVRLILLDHAVLQQQSLPLGVHHGGLYVADFCNEQTHLCRVMVFVEIGRHAPFQPFGFAHIDDGTLVIEKTVHARLFGQGFENEFRFSRTSFIM